ncbi:MAG: DUF2061 domain-containing protein [Candidatus Bathyarchaeia archaeon]
MENRMRNVLKSVSFRLIATLITIVLVLVFTREIMVSLQVGDAEFFAKIVLYYFHERLWNMLRFGRK